MRSHATDNGPAGDCDERGCFPFKERLAGGWSRSVMLLNWVLLRIHPVISSPRSLASLRRRTLPAKLTAVWPRGKAGRPLASPSWMLSCCGVRWGSLPSLNGQAFNNRTDPPTGVPVSHRPILLAQGSRSTDVPGALNLIDLLSDTASGSRPDRPGQQT